MEEDFSTIRLPGNFLRNNGLLFEINRSVLHPFGFALSTDEDGEVAMQVTDDPAGLAYAEETLEEGYAKYQSFLEDKGYEKLHNRLKEEGFHVQPMPGQADTLRDIAETFAETHHASDMTVEALEKFASDVYKMGYEKGGRNDG